MYSGKLDLKKSLKVSWNIIFVYHLKIMRQHLQWRTLPERGILTPSAKKFMVTSFQEAYFNRNRKMALCIFLEEISSTGQSSLLICIKLTLK